MSITPLSVSCTDHGNNKRSNIAQLDRNTKNDSFSFKAFRLRFLFLITLIIPLGQTLTAQTTGDFRTNGDVTFTSATNWERYNGSAWVAAVAAPVRTDGVITIRTGNTAVLTSTISLDQIIVASGGVFNIETGRQLNLMNEPGVDLDVSGTLNNSGSINPATGTTISFNANSVYNHARNGNNIPVAAWASESTCLISGVTTNVPTGLNQSFGNFSWNCPSQTLNNASLLNMDNRTLTGDFNLISTGTGSIRLATATSMSLTVNGKMNITGGTMNMSNGAGTGTINLKGDFSMSGGILTETSTGSGAIVFSGNSSQAFFKSGGNITNNINFSVSNNAILDMSDQVLDGTAGAFTLNSGGTLITANVQGITQNPSVMSGSIQNTGARNFNTAANYVYNGLFAQVTGTGLPSTVFNLTVNNPAGVTLTGSVTASNSLTLLSGNVLTGANILALSNGIVGSLNYTGGMIIGKFRRTVNTFTGTDYLFPIGTTGNYRPASFNFSSLSSPIEITSEFIETAPVGFTSYSDDVVTLTSIFSEGYWRFSSSGMPDAEYSLSLTGSGFTSYDINEVARITGRDNSNTTWRALGSHSGLDSTTIIRQGIANLNTVSFDFALATGCASASIGYAYERILEIDHIKVEGGKDLYNFPMLVSITGEDYLQSFPSGRIFSRKGYDIIFTDENYNKLDHQIEFYDGVNGDFIAWVRIPELSSSENTLIRMLYSNPEADTDPSVTTVWDSDYKGVWHMDDNGLADFTSFNRPAYSYNSPSFPVGPVYSSMELNGGNQYAEIINAPHLNVNGNLTVSAWIYLNSGGLDQKIAGNQNGVLGGYKFGVYTNNKVEFEIRNSSNTPFLNRNVSGGTTLNTGQWYYVAGVSSDITDSIKTYVNGLPERPFQKTGTLVPSSNNMTIGREPWTGSYYFNGRIDELRISARVRSDGWLRTEYNNQSDPASFYSIATTEESAAYLPAGTMCSVPVTLDYGYPSGGTYSGNPYIAGNVFTPPGPGTYTLTYSFTDACGTTSDTKNIIITAIPGSPVAEDREYCIGTITYLQAESGVNHRWYKDGVLVSTANPFSTGQTTPGIYNYTVTQSLNGCESPPTPVALSIFAATTITSQPGNFTSCVGNSAGFGIKVSGPNLSYQWRKGSVNLVDGGNISGATTDSLVISNLQASDAGVYSCIVSSSCGSPVTSNDATLIVEPLPSPVITGNGEACPYTGGFIYSVTDIPGHTYSWNVSGGTIQGPSVGSSIIVSWDSPGMGVVSVTESVSAGCSVSSPDFTVQITDTEPPVIVNCPSDIVVSNTAGTCTAIVSWIEPEALDNCTLPANLLWTKSHLPGTIFNTGITTVTYTAQDESGNESAICIFTITVNDTEPPSITAPGTISVNTDPGSCLATGVSLGIPVTADNCHIDNVTNNAPASFGIGTTTITRTVTDASGNSSTATQDVIVTDDEDPVALCKSFDAILDASGFVSLTPEDIDNGSTDNCNISSRTVFPDVFSASDIGPNIVTLTVTDDSGNSSICMAIVTVIDDLPPQAYCRDITVQLDDSGTAHITAADIDNGSSDNNTIAYMSVTPDTFDCSDIGPNTVTLIVTDASGNSSICTSVVTVEDNIPPSVFCKDVTIYLDSEGNANLTPDDVYNGSSDNCPGGLILSLNRTSFSCADTGAPVAVDLTATDASGNSATCSALITVLDTISPIVNTKTYNLVLDAAGTGTLLPSDVDNGTSDNCSIVSLSVAPDSFTCGDQGIQTVTFTAVDASGNISSRDVNINVTTSLSVTDMSLNTCDPQIPGAVFSAVTSGGSGSYTYFWDGIEDATSPFLIPSASWPYFQFSNTSTAETPFFNNLLPDGIYNISLVVIDSNGCSDTSKMVLNRAGVTFNNIILRNSQACEGETRNYSVGLQAGVTYNWAVENGTILTPQPYTNNVDVRWDSGVLQGVVVTTLTITNTEGINCVSSVVDSVAINGVPVPSFTGADTDACAGSEVTYTLSDTYSSYLWDVSGGTVTGGGTAGTNYISVRWGNGPAGMISVEVTSAASCSGTTTLDISVYNLEGAITIQSDITCNGANDGTVTAAAVPGTGLPPYEYSVDGGTYQPDGSFTGLAPGSHTIRIRDGLSCMIDLPFSLDQPPLLTGVISSQTNVECYGETTGSFTIAASGGTSPYEYSLNGGDYQSSGTFNNLPAGSGTVTIRDDNNCTAVVPVTITQPSAPLQGVVVTGNISCLGGSNGSINLSVIGGVPPYSYLWNTGATTEDITGLQAGNYSVLITDASGCIETVSVDLTEPSTALTGVITDKTDVSVPGGNDGSVTVTASGGIAPYLYRLNSEAFQPSGTFESLTAGTYTVTIQDNSLCTYVVAVIIEEPPTVLSVSLVEHVNVLCAGTNTGSLTVSVEGGTPPYQYSIDGGPYQAMGEFGSLGPGTYQVTVRDAVMSTESIIASITEPMPLNVTLTKTENICFGGDEGTISALVNGGTGPYSYLWSTVPAQTSPIATGLTAGAYNVIVTDANGCNASAEAIIAQPADAMIVTVTGTDNVCAGASSGTAAATVSGGTPPYIWSWNTSPVSNDPEIFGLSAGNYIVTVTDSKGCTGTASVEIRETPALSVEAEIIKASCPDTPDGSVILTVTGGMQPYNVIWSDNVTTQNRNSILPGTYVVVVSDYNGCSGSLTVEVDFMGTYNCLVIPDIITPNNDGHNDEWIITNIDLYPNAEVRIFNRWGKMIFRTKNISANPWDGRTDGKLVPTDSYQYILYLNDGSAPRSGVITVIR